MKEMIGGCCVCSDDRGYDENPIVYCDGHGCNVAVHQACYGIITVPTGPWFCRKCESQERAARVRCELCPQKEGALKRTDVGGWCHVVCALYIPEVSFGSINSMEPIILKKVPQDRFNKSCYICEEQGRGNKAMTGACMQCNYRTGCKQHFHVTCAQSMGLLREESGTKKKVSYCGYCNHHFKKLFNIQRKDSLQKLIKMEGDFQTDKLKLEKPKLGEAAFNESSPTSVKVEPATIRTSGKFTTANFTESLLEEAPTNFEDPQKLSEAERKFETYSCSDSSQQPLPSHGRDVESLPADKPYVPVSSIFTKTSSSSSSSSLSATSESFTKLSHPSLLRSALNPTSDSSSTCSFPSFGQYMSPSRPNDFSEIRPDDSGSNAFGGVQESESSMKAVKTEPRKKLKVDKKQSVRGRKSKDSVLGEPPHLTSPPPPSDFTNLSESPLLHPHDNSMTHKRNQCETPWIPFPSSSSSSHNHYSPPVYDLDSLGGNLESLPTTMEELLESQWRLGSQFLMQQGQRLDIVDLLNMLQQTKERNRQMEKTIEDLTARKNYLVTTNARLAMSLMGAPMPTLEDSNVKMNKSPLKKEAQVDSSYGNLEPVESRVTNPHPPQKNQQQPSYSFISTGLLSVNQTPPPLSINHFLQQPGSPHNNSNNSFMDKMTDHLRNQQKQLQATQEQHKKQQPALKERPPSSIQYSMPVTPHSFFPSHLQQGELGQQLYVLPSKNQPKKHHNSPKNK